VVTARVHRASLQPTGPGDRESVLGGLDLGPQGPKPIDHARDAVALLEAKLGSAAHDSLPLRDGAEKPDQRQLVDRDRDLVPLDGGPLERAGRHVELTHGLVLRLGAALL
jgi:hypothetical protein